jgi:LCP family protein required for cell wall assembly
LKKKRYTLYQIEGSPKSRWQRIVLWSAVALAVAVIATAGGSYVWFRAEVSAANERVTPEIKAALEEKPDNVGQPVSGSEEPAGADIPDEVDGLAGASSAADVTTSTVPPSPSAMNILVLGSDSRSKKPTSGGRSDTIMVVHVDPDQDYLSVLSLPRDLRVDIPGYGRGKLNTAFGYGGAPLAIRTIERLTGVDINHYLEIGFGAFVDIVDSLGGIYVDVDRRYFNDDPTWEMIDIYPGYQLLHGEDALDFVRFRHDRNMDFGRMLRQQRFMNAVREQAMGWNLPFKLPGLISALFSNVITDLEANEILKLAYWGVRLDGDRIRQITVTGSTPTINGASYVVVSNDRLKKAVSQLLDAGSLGASIVSTSVSSTTTTEAPDLTGLQIDVVGRSGLEGEAAATAEWLRSLGAMVGTADDTDDSVKSSSVEYPSGMLTEAKRVARAADVGSTRRRSSLERITIVVGKDFVLPPAFAVPPTPETIPDAEQWQEIADEVPFAVQAPAHVPSRYEWTRKIPDNDATYEIEVDGGTQPAFRVLYASKTNEHQVFGITETTWLDAPAASDGLQITHEGTVFTVVRTDQRVARVWWKADGVLYFVSNTLSYLLDQEEMLEIAESMIPVPPR